MMNARTVKGAVAVTLMMFGAACGGDENKDGKGGYDIASSPLEGQIGGEAFQVKSGFAADVFGDGDYWVELHATESEDPCSRQFPSGPHIILTTDLQPADTALGLQNNITFTYGEAQNDIGTTGRLVIDGVSDGRLTGGLYASMRDNEVDGTFDVVVCGNEE